MVEDTSEKRARTVTKALTVASNAFMAARSNPRGLRLVAKKSEVVLISCTKKRMYTEFEVGGRSVQMICIRIKSWLNSLVQ